MLHEEGAYGHHAIVDSERRVGTDSSRSRDRGGHLAPARFRVGELGRLFDSFKSASESLRLGADVPKQTEEALPGPPRAQGVIREPRTVWLL